MSITIGDPIDFGATEPKPLRGFPEGRARVRLRSNEYPIVWVRTSAGIREFIPKAIDGYWEPALELARNDDATRA